MLTDTDFDAMEGESSRAALDGVAGLTTIDASDKDLAQVAAQSWRAIERANRPPRLFQFGSGNEPMLVRIIESDQGYKVMQALDVNRLRHELARVATWIEPTRKACRPSKPPLDVVKDMLAAPVYPLPVLRRITRTPFIDHDLNLVTTSGYHTASRVYFDPGCLNIPAIPERPTDQDVASSLLLLEDMLCDFHFAEPSDRAHAYALLLLPHVHELIGEVTPMHDIEGPIAGSGKGLLSGVLTYPALGHEPPMSGEPDSDGEFNKLLTSILMTGASHIFFDNIRRPVASGAWAKAITNPIFSNRILSVNRVLETPMRLTWVLTANNPTFSDEMARRVIRIRLDPGCEHPEERSNFRHPELLRWVAEHRAEILYAMLVIVQHWVSRGCQPADHKRALGSFERWATIMGGILNNAGIAGFLEGRLEAVAVADSETMAWSQFVTEWYVRYGDKPVLAKDLFPIAKEIAGIYLGRDAKNEHSQVSTFGQGLRARRNRIFSICIDDGDLLRQSVKLESAGMFRRAVQWKLRSLEYKEAA